MIKINIKKQNIVTNSAIFNTQTEADVWLRKEIDNNSFGKPEHQLLISPEIQAISYQAAVLDEQGNEISPEVLAVPFQAAVYETVVSEYSVEVVDVTAEIKLQKLRAKRDSLINEADKIINKAYDLSSGISAAKSYRQALRDVTEPFKADPTLLNTFDLETFIFPAKP